MVSSVFSLSFFLFVRPQWNTTSIIHIWFVVCMGGFVCVSRNGLHCMEITHIAMFDKSMTFLHATADNTLAPLRFCQFFCSHTHAHAHDLYSLWWLKYRCERNSCFFWRDNHFTDENQIFHRKFLYSMNISNSRILMVFTRKFFFWIKKKIA